MANKWPTALDVERLVLGSILLDDAFLNGDAGSLSDDDFSLEKHKTILRRCKEIHGRGEKLDRIVLASELMRYGELDRCDGLSYLVSMDEGLPELPSIDSYVRVLKEKSSLRRIIQLGQKAINTAQLETEPPAKILRDLNRAVTRMEIASGRKDSFLSPGDIIKEHGGIGKFAMGAIDPGVSWGFPQLDEHLLGMQRG